MHRIILILFSSFLVLFSQAETLKQLKKKQQKAKQNIEMTNRLLRENQRTQKNTVSNLAVLKKQISERQTLIKSLNEEVFLLDRNLNVLNKEKVELETQLSEAKAEYAKLIRHGYYHKTRSSQLMFVFSSESVSQAYRRMRYVQQYSRYRKEQTQKIQELTDALNGKQQALIATKNAKSETLINKQQEHQNLQRSQEKKEQMLSSLTKKESELKVLLEKQQKQAAQLNKKVDDMIAAEIAAAERRAKAKADAERKAKQKSTASAKSSDSKSSTASSSAPSVSMTKEEGLIAGGFEANRGRLPWPVKGVITGHFGLHPHPVLDHVQVNNKGIYIQTSSGADACAVYDGEVTQVFAIPGNNTAIIVKHGNYRTVYANLGAAYVQSGTKVKSRQKLGRVYVDASRENRSELYFMVYKNSALQNPEVWLSK